ncbi:MAG: hypothetical protein ACI86H_000745 [bacterium]|jgi:hypothetical protein
MIFITVEGIWQGLKVFESHKIDISKFEVTAMRGLKRTVRRFGKVLGHQAGVNSAHLLTYEIARKEIYLPTYQWVLENRVSDLLEKLDKIQQQEQVILLDYETNCDLENLSKPLSHAGLIKRYLDDEWPSN